MPPEKTNDVLAVEFKYLKEGQDEIKKGFQDMGRRLDNVAEALVGLIRITEQVNAINARLVVVETASKDRADIASRGQTYMDATKWLLPAFLTFVVSFLGWISWENKDILDRIHDVELLVKTGEKK